MQVETLPLLMRCPVAFFLNLLMRSTCSVGLWFVSTTSPLFSGVLTQVYVLTMTTHSPGHSKWFKIS